MNSYFLWRKVIFTMKYFRDLRLGITLGGSYALPVLLIALCAVVGWMGLAKADRHAGSLTREQGNNVSAPAPEQARANRPAPAQRLSTPVARSHLPAPCVYRSDAMGRQIETRTIDSSPDVRDAGLLRGADECTGSSEVTAPLANQPEKRRLRVVQAASAVVFQQPANFPVGDQVGIPT